MAEKLPDGGENDVGAEDNNVFSVFRRDEAAREKEGEKEGWAR